MIRTLRSLLSGRVAESAATTGARRLTDEEKAILRAGTAKATIDQPSGSAVEKEPGIFHYSGIVTFKLPYRVMTGRARSITWTEGRLSVNCGRGAVDGYSVKIVPDLTNTLHSRVQI